MKQEEEVDSLDLETGCPHNSISTCLIPPPTPEFLEGMKNALNGPTRTSYDPPLPSSLLMFWLRSDFGILREFVRLYPEIIDYVAELPWLDDDGEITNKYTDQLLKIAESSFLRRQMETERFMKSKSIWKYENLDDSSFSSDLDWTYPNFGYGDVDSSYEVPWTAWQIPPSDHFQLYEDGELDMTNFNFNRLTRGATATTADYFYQLPTDVCEDVLNTAIPTTTSPSSYDVWSYDNFCQYYTYPEDTHTSWLDDSVYLDSPSISISTPPSPSLLSQLDSPSPPTSLPPLVESKSKSALPTPTSEPKSSTNSNKLFEAFMAAYTASYLATNTADNSTEETNTVTEGKKRLTNVYAQPNNAERKSSFIENLYESSESSSSTSEESGGEGPIIEIRGKRNSTFRSLSKRGTKREFLCVFCKGNNEPEDIYKSHPIRVNGIVMCPYLRNHVCALCKATGDHAHTIKYCPENKRGFFAMKAIERAANAEIAAAGVSRRIRIEESPFTRFQSTPSARHSSSPGTSYRGTKHHGRNKRRNGEENNVFSRLFGNKSNHCEKHHHFGVRKISV